MRFVDLILSIDIYLPAVFYPMLYEPTPSLVSRHQCVLMKVHVSVVNSGCLNCCYHLILSLQKVWFVIWWIGFILQNGGFIRKPWLYSWCTFWWKIRGNLEASLTFRPVQSSSCPYLLYFSLPNLFFRLVVVIKQINATLHHHKNTARFWRHI